MGGDVLSSELLRCPVPSSSFNTAREEKVVVVEVDLEPPAPQYSQAPRSWSGTRGRRASSALPAREPAGRDQWRRPPRRPDPVLRRRAPGRACGRRQGLRGCWPSPRPLPAQPPPETLNLEQTAATLWNRRGKERRGMETIGFSG
jgi:hypothetical protein